MYKATYKLKSDTMFQEERMTSPGHLLIVDNDLERANRLCAVLTEDGYTCETVATGREALDLLASYRERFGEIWLEIGFGGCGAE